MVRIALFVTLLFVFACSKKGTPKPEKDEVAPPADSSVISLAGKSKSEVFHLKYDKAQLVCRLWMQFGTSLDLSKNPDAQFEVNLADDKSLNVPFQARANSERKVMEFSVTIRSLQISDVGYWDQLGHDYTMKNSPVLDVDFQYLGRLAMADGKVFSEKGTSSHRLFERVPRVLLNTTDTTDVAMGSQFDLINCTIETQIKPAYQDQFKKN